MNPAKNPVLAAATLTDSPELMALPQRQKVVLVMDLVESVRLMAANELAVVDHWRGFVRHATTNVLPKHQGRMVKSLGDGIMVEFESPRNATNAAVQLHRYFDTANAALPPDQQLYLRAGLNTAQVYIDDIDIYGSGVNLAARVASLAGPGETMVTAEVRDGLTDGLDAKVEDMGECYLKHVAEPVRTFRVGEAGPTPILTSPSEDEALVKPTLAIIPFTSRTSDTSLFSVGDLIADSVIAKLNQSTELRIISRLSSAVFAGRIYSINEIKTNLGANYVLSGNYWLAESGAASKLLLTVELADTKSGDVVWSDRFNTHVGDLLQSESESVQRIAQATHGAVLNREVKKTDFASLPTLAAYSLQLVGVSMMHRSSNHEFERGQQLLSTLVDRHRKMAQAHAWLAKWHVLRVVRGSSPEPERDTALALKACEIALDACPTNGMALAIRGYALTQLVCDPTRAKECLDLAISHAPNEALAWLYLSVWSTHWDDAREAVTYALRAKALSPLDPHTYFLETILANAYAFSRQSDLAIDTANRALRLDKNHAPTLRALILAQVESGREIDARITCQQLLRITPNLSITGYQQMGNGHSPARKRVAHALRLSGVPEFS